MHAAYSTPKLGYQIFYNMKIQILKSSTVSRMPLTTHAVTKCIRYSTIAVRPTYSQKEFIGIRDTLCSADFYRPYAISVNPKLQNNEGSLNMCI